MATTLYSDEIKNVEAAAEKFSSEKGLVLLRPHRACCKAFYFTIPSGCYALVSRHGADEEYTDPTTGTKSIVWPPGLHFPHPPWVRVSNLVSQQAIVLDLPVKACKTKDNVTVNIDVALAFRIMGDATLGEDPDLVRKFVHELKPRGLEQQLRDAQDEAVRALARSLMHTEIYGIRSGENLKHIQQSVVGSGIGGIGGIGAGDNGNGGNDGVASSEESISISGSGSGESRGNSIPIMPPPVLPPVGEEKMEEDHEIEVVSVISTPSVATDPSGRLGAAPIAAVASSTAMLQPAGSHRDETLVGRSDQEDRDAASAARSVGTDVTDYMKQRLNRQFMPQGVEILSIMIESCRLPQEIESQMEEKTKVISKNAQQRMFHQNNMQNTRMEEEVVTLLQTFEEKKLQEETAGVEKINEEQVKLNDAIAEAIKSEASIREEAHAKIQKLRAENSLEVQRVVSRKEENIAKTRAEAEKEASQLQATTKLEVEKKLAETSLVAEKNRAEASRVMSKAEGIIAPYLARKKVHTTSMKQIDVYRSLAKNQNLIICDSEDGDTNILAVAESILAENSSATSAGHSSSSRSAVMAQLSLMHHGSSGLFSHGNSHSQKDISVQSDSLILQP